MKAIILCYSQTGNTEKLIEAITSKMDVDVHPADQENRELLSDRKLVGLASGIYWAKHDRCLFKAAEFIPPKADVFIISSSGIRFRFMVNVNQFLLKRKIKRLGLNLAFLNLFV